MARKNKNCYIATKPLENRINKGFHEHKNENKTLCRFIKFNAKLVQNWYKLVQIGTELVPDWYWNWYKKTE